jgi:hypothetical protein
MQAERFVERSAFFVRDEIRIILTNTVIFRCAVLPLNPLKETCQFRARV